MNPSRHARFPDEAGVSEVSKNTRLVGSRQVRATSGLLLDPGVTYCLAEQRVPILTPVACLNAPAGRQMLGVSPETALIHKKIPSPHLVVTQSPGLIYPHHPGSQPGTLRVRLTPGTLCSEPASKSRAAWVHGGAILALPPWPEENKVGPCSSPATLEGGLAPPSPPPADPAQLDGV